MSIYQEFNLSEEGFPYVGNKYKAYKGKETWLVQKVYKKSNVVQCKDDKGLVFAVSVMQFQEAVMEK